MDQTRIDLILEINERLEKVHEAQKRIEEQFRAILRRQANLQEELSRDDQPRT